ncbi:MAG: AAA family ATPase [Nitrosotalea sp.]
MSNTILVMGESGSGKSSSIRNLNPKETFILNVIDKPLPFKGYKKNYHKLSVDGTEGNYYVSDDNGGILRTINLINTKRLDIINLVIDDFQYTMGNEFMRRAKERGYEKFTEIGQNAWSIINHLTKTRGDLNCIVLSHTDSNEQGKMKLKTIGRMLDDKITLEGMFTVILQTTTIDNQYRFITQSDGQHIARSPQGMFDQKYIDNDLSYVLQKMKEYFEDDIKL